ncbi:MAG: hypothetical protein KAG28_04245 [Cocleimonas sp.]|nr:hypothetical protein [Cocleimonas sp.]
MIQNKLKLVALTTSFIVGSFFTLSAYAGSSVLKVKTANAKTAPSRLAAKSMAIKTFGRRIRILSNRVLKTSGCRRIVLKTAQGERETLKLCGKNLPITSHSKKYKTPLTNKK